MCLFEKSIFTGKYFYKFSFFDFFFSVQSNEFSTRPIMGCFSSNHMLPLCLRLREKSARPKWTIFKHFSEILIVRNVCMSDILEFCPLSVLCSASAIYTSFCRCLKYLLKVRHIILVYPNVVGFLIFRTLGLGRSKTMPCV